MIAYVIDTPIMLNLWSGDALRMGGKGQYTSGLRKQQLNAKRQTKPCTSKTYQLLLNQQDEKSLRRLNELPNKFFLPKGQKKHGRPPVIRPRLLKREKGKGGVDWYRYRRLLRMVLASAYHELQRSWPEVIF